MVPVSLNPNNPPKQVAVAVTSVNLVASGIVTVTAPMRFPRRATAEYSNTANALIGGELYVSTAPAAGGTSGMPHVVQVIQVSGIQADVQFWGGNLSGAVSGVLQPPSPAISGAGYSGGTLTVTFWGD